MLIEAIDVNAMYVFTGEAEQLACGEHGVAVGFAEWGGAKPRVLFAVYFASVNRQLVFAVDAEALIEAPEDCMCDSCWAAKYRSLAESTRAQLTDMQVPYYEHLNQTEFANALEDI